MTAEGQTVVERARISDMTGALAPHADVLDKDQFALAMANDKRQQELDRREAQMQLDNWSRARLDLLKQTFCKGATDVEFDLFIWNCKRLRLSPEARQIWSVPRKDRDTGEVTRTTQVSIDGFRVVAERTGKYAGQTPVQWCGTDGVWVDVWLKTEPPHAARVGVHHKDFREPLYRVALVRSFKQFGPFWSKMPEHMIAKVAEALALRAAFPNDLAGVYIPEEMEMEQGGSSNDDYGAAQERRDEQPRERTQSKQEKRSDLPKVPIIELATRKDYKVSLHLKTDAEVASYCRQLHHMRDRNNAELAKKDLDAEKRAKFQGFADNWYPRVIGEVVAYAEQARGLVGEKDWRKEPTKEQQNKQVINETMGEDSVQLDRSVHPSSKDQNLKEWTRDMITVYIDWLTTSYTGSDKKQRISVAEICYEYAR